MCDSFIRIPKKRQDPAYYEVVANPIDLQRIQQKIKTEEYDDVEDMTADMMLLVKNAKQFHKVPVTRFNQYCTNFLDFRKTRQNIRTQWNCTSYTKLVKQNLPMTTGHQLKARERIKSS